MTAGRTWVLEKALEELWISLQGYASLILGTTEMHRAPKNIWFSLKHCTGLLVAHGIEHRAPGDLWRFLEHCTGHFLWGSLEDFKEHHETWGVSETLRRIWRGSGLQRTWGGSLKHCKGLLRCFGKVHKDPNDLLGIYITLHWSARIDQQDFKEP